MDASATSFTQNIFELHLIIMWICVIIMIVVYGTMIYATIIHHKSDTAIRTEIHFNTKMEIVWTLLSFLIVLTLASPAMQIMINASGV